MSSWFKNQPVIHSLWGDLFGLHFVPVVCLALMALHPDFVRGPENFLMTFPVALILLVDWGHIFAQWFRIYSNPLETRLARWVYPLSLVATFLVFFSYLSVGGRGLKTCLVYFVIFHFMKQQFGFMRILARGEYRGRPWMRRLEDGYFYLGVVTPVLAWHVEVPAPLVKMPWISTFIHFSWQPQLYQLLLACYAGVALVYWVMQIKVCREQHHVPLTKYLAILFSHFGWGGVALLPDYQLFFWIMVVFYHNLAYFFFVWATGRKDRTLTTQSEIPWWHWTSWPGLLVYPIAVTIISDVAGWVGSIRSFRGVLSSFVMLRLFFPLDMASHWLQAGSAWLSTFDLATVKNVGWAWYLAIQGHHYFIDRYLWRKEKTLAWVLRGRP